MAEDDRGRTMLGRTCGFTMSGAGRTISLRDLSDGAGRTEGPLGRLLLCCHERTAGRSPEPIPGE